MKKILIIEDDIAVLENIEELLESESYEVYRAENGFDGMALAQSIIPDLIICDIMMPNIDGYGVLKELQKDKRTSIIPFIFLSAKAEKHDIRYGMELGADDFLAKPFTPDELFTSVKTRLHKHETIEFESESKLKELRFNLATSLPHELRTPLNGILGSAQLLLRYFDNMDREEILQLHDTIFSSAKRLHKLILNYLVYSEVELLISDKEHCRKLREAKTHDSADIITEIFLETGLLCGREKDVKFDLIHCSIQILPDHFRKICEELADNAFKFSNLSSSIDVKTFITNNNFCLRVHDTGRSITPEQIARIGAYIQFDRNIYEQQGSGLGLIIIKRIIQIYDGSLTIESPDNNSTVIKINLPLALAD